MLEKSPTLLAQLQVLNSQDSLELINEAIAQTPEAAELYFLQGSLLADLGEFQQAKLAYFQSLDIDPDNEICRLQLALIHFRLGESKQIFYLLSPYLVWQERSTCQSLMAHSLLTYLQGDVVKSKEFIAQALDTEEVDAWHGVIEKLTDIYNQYSSGEGKSNQKIAVEVEPKDKAIKDTVMTERILDHLYNKTY
jgi:tetratricopeptide (TPR) repeat protein